MHAVGPSGTVAPPTHRSIAAGALVPGEAGVATPAATSGTGGPLEAETAGRALRAPERGGPGPLPRRLLVVGLGNPGPRYAETRHNAGFAVLELLARRHGARWSRPLGVRGEQAAVRLRGAELTLLRPLTFMNASGEAVGQALRRLRLQPPDIVLVYDDLDLPFGRLRLRPDGGSGGHRGVASVLETLGTDAFPRVRVGIGRPGEGRDAAEYVLSPPQPAEWPAWTSCLERAADAVEAIACEGLEAAMSRFNAPPPAAG